MEHEARLGMIIAYRILIEKHEGKK